MNLLMKMVLIAQDAEQVVAIWMACLAEPEEAKQVVEQAHKVLQRNQGSLQKHIGVINRYLAENHEYRFTRT